MPHQFDSWESYFYPETYNAQTRNGVLRNIPDIRDAAALRTYDYRMSFARRIELELRPELVTRTFDGEHMKQIHGHLFGSTFEWAGQYRTVNMAKGGGAAFADAHNGAIDAYLDNVRVMVERTDWAQLSHAEFSERAAEIFAWTNTGGASVPRRQRALLKSVYGTCGPAVPLYVGLCASKPAGVEPGIGVQPPGYWPVRRGSGLASAGVPAYRCRTDPDDNARCRPGCAGPLTLERQLPQGTGPGRSYGAAVPAPWPCEAWPRLWHQRTRSRTMSHVIGYARVSTREQNPEAQEAELRAAGAARVYVDHGESSRFEERPQWIACLDHLMEGDTLVIRALDRIAGSELMAIEIIRDLGRRGVRIKSLTEPFLDVDTSTPMGEAIVGIMAVLAQLRISTIRENTRRGLAHARAQGRVGGRPSVMTAERTEAAVKMRAEGQSIAHIAKVLGVGSSSVSRALSRVEDERAAFTSIVDGVLSEHVPDEAPLNGSDHSSPSPR